MVGGVSKAFKQVRPKHECAGGSVLCEGHLDGDGDEGDEEFWGGVPGNNEMPQAGPQAQRMF